MFTILSGYETTEKNEGLFAAIAGSHRESGRPVTVVVPEQFTLGMEEALISALSLEGLMGIEVTSMSRLVNKVATGLVDSERIALNRLGRKLLVKQIVESLESSLKVYQRSVRRAGLIEEFEQMLVNLKHEKVTSDELAAFRDQLGDKDLLRRKIEDLLLIYEAYNQAVDRSYFDEDQRIALFAEYIDYLPELVGGDVYFYGFIGFSRQEMDIIRAIEAKAHGVWLSLPHHTADASGIFAFTSKTLRQFEGLFGNPGCTQFEQTLPASVIFARRLSGFEPGEVDHPVRLFTARSPHSECDHVAGEIHRLLSEGAIGINDIQVMLLDSGTYRPLLCRALDLYGIPYFADETSALIDTPIIQAILALLRFHALRYDTTALFEYLKPMAGPAELEAIDRLENHALATGIHHSRWASPLEDPSLETTRKRYVEPLIACHDRLEQPMTTERFAGELMQILISLGAPKRIEAMVEWLKEQGDESEVLKWAQVWNKFVTIIEQVSEASSHREMTLEDQIAALEMAFREERIGIIPTRLDGIRIQVLERSVYLPNRITFVVGMNEMNLPRTRSDSAVLTEEEKGHLYQFGIDLKDDTRFYRQKEVLDFFSAVSKARDGLWLSYARSDLKGKATGPSHYFKRAAEVARQPVIEDDLLSEQAHFAHHVGAGRPRELALIRQLRELRAGRSVSQDWLQWIAWIRTHDPRLFEAGLGHAFSSNLPSGPLEGLRESPLRTSITRLEKFAQCPFAYFARYDLRLAERDLHRVTPIEIGNLYHEILERIVKAWIGGDWDRQVEEIVEEIISEPDYAVFLHSEQSRYLIDRVTVLSGKIVGNIREFYSHSAYRPVRAEVGFGEKAGPDGFEPIVIRTEDGGELVIEGKIDRIDAFRPQTSGTLHCNVIDYKTGLKGLELGRMMAGIDYQLPVYLMACQRNPEALGASEVQVSGVFYYRIRDAFIDMGVTDLDKKLQGKWSMNGLLIDDGELIAKMDQALAERGSGSSDYLPVRLNKDGSLGAYTLAATEEGLDFLVTRMEDRIAKQGRDMLSGDVSIHPYRTDKENACRFCPYDNVCKFEVRFDDNHYRELRIGSNKDVLMRLNACEGGEEDD